VLHIGVSGFSVQVSGLEPETGHQTPQAWSGQTHHWVSPDQFRVSGQAGGHV